MIKLLTPLFLLLLTNFFPSLALAEMKVFIRDYTYIAGEEDSKGDSRRLALSAVREELLNEIGTYIYSEMSIKQLSDGTEMTEHEVKSISGGFIKIEVLEEKWDGYSFYLKAKLIADVERVLREVKSLQSNDKENKQLKAILVKSQKQNESLSIELARLHKQLIETKKTEELKSVTMKYDGAQKRLTAIQLSEKANEYYRSDPPDYVKAVSLFLEAAELGDMISQFFLGIIYYHGRGVTKDNFEAFKWFQLAAQQGLPEAQTNIGLMYEKGEGVSPDLKEGLKWFRLAAEQGIEDAQYKIGLFYRDNRRDNHEALKWFRLAAEQGHAWAQYELANMYAGVSGVKRDPIEGFKWLNLAAKNGHLMSQSLLKHLSRQ